MSMEKELVYNLACQWKSSWCMWFVNGKGTGVKLGLLMEMGGGAGVKLGLLMEKGLVYIKKMVHVVKKLVHVD